MNQAQQAHRAERVGQYSLQELPFSNVKSIGSRGSVLMLAVRFEEVVSRGAGAAVALFSGAVVREMYRTKILAVKVHSLLACLYTSSACLHCDCRQPFYLDLACPVFLPGSAGQGPEGSASVLVCARPQALSWLTHVALPGRAGCLSGKNDSV